MTQLEEIAKICENVPLHFDLSYGNVCDFVLDIYNHQQSGDERIYFGQDNDLSCLLSKGEVALKDWCLEHKGGY